MYKKITAYLDICQSEENERLTTNATNLIPQATHTNT